ncbi:hypothetical protein BDQ17DRAFT_1184397, partial [Cyathus striatus]
ICEDCYYDLSREGTSKPPWLSLANNLWVGAMPWELQKLSFAEQLLIAHVYPRVFTFKLYPKKAGGSRENLQRGMRGNVSSFELNVEDMTKMVHGDLMPRPVRGGSVKYCIITITFIGVGTLPKKYLWNTFHVRRNAIGEALQWLKANNPKYYGGIKIDMEHLGCLPADDIPDEI